MAHRYQVSKKRPTPSSGQSKVQIKMTENVEDKQEGNVTLENFKRSVPTEYTTQSIILSYLTGSNTYTA